MLIRRIFFLCFFGGLIFSPVFSQQGAPVSAYIDKHKGIAKQHMVEYGIPASIKMAQAILESGFGTSELAVHANNHFGIKCHGWQYATYYKDDDKKNECFRSYVDPVQSFKDHSEFLSTRQRYSFLFDLDPLDYKGWAKGLREAGYATNPRYPQLLIRIIEEHELYKFDQKVVKGDRMAETTSKDVRDDFSPVSISREREIKLNNRIKYIYAREGDTPESIADEMEMWVWQIYRYNELEEGETFEQGDIVYLQPKRRRGEESYHTVRDGETLYDISQRYGVRLSSLYRRNNMEPDSSVHPGQKIYLRGRAGN